ncbi:TPA: hypothetical protein ACKP5W_004906 [Pseudomonas aeruginosa]
MSIDWSKAPDGCIGAFARIVGNQRKAFFVFSKRPSGYMSREGYEGEGEDGSYHVFSEFWEWLDKPWNGQGLPPVGTVCEWHESDGWAYTESKVVAYTDDGLFVCMQKPGRRPEVLRIDNCDFRPIRTPEQIAAAERWAAIQQMLAFADVKYSAGELMSPKEYVETAVAALYDAGYRRQESST